MSRKKGILFFDIDGTLVPMKTRQMTQTLFDALLSLKEKGVLIRWLKGISTSPYVRITIGSMEQMEAFLRATKEYLKEAQDA